jgi:hypothetical protein
VSKEFDSEQRFIQDNGRPCNLLLGVNGSDFSSEYGDFLKVPKGESCAIVFKNFWDQPDNYFTEIKKEFLLFEKRELSNGSKKFSGIWVFDECEWDDSIPGGLTGDGVWVIPAEITLSPDASNGKTSVSFTLKDEGPFVEKVIEKITKHQKGPPSLIYVEGLDQVTYKLGTDMYDESGGGSVHDIHDIEFSRKDLGKLVLSAAISPEKSAKLTTEGKETADIEQWAYGTIDGYSYHSQDKPVQIELSLKIDSGYQSKFNLSKLPESPQTP